MSGPSRLEDIPFRETLADEPQVPALANIFASNDELRAAARLYWLRHTKAGVLNTVFHQLLSFCPSSFVSNFGEWLVPSARRSYRHKIFPKRIERNFKALTAGLWRTPEEQELGLDRWWINIGRTISEFSIVNRLWRESRIEVEGLEHLQTVQGSGGVPIFVSMHLATWEALFVAIHTHLAGPSIGPFQPETNRFKNRIVHAIRKQRNQYLFPPGQKSAYRLRRLMATRQYSMTIFIDEVRDKQVHVPLFGRKPPSRGNVVVAAKIANICDGTLLPTYLTRTGPARFKLTILPAVPKTGEQQHYDIPETVLSLNNVFEPIVLDRIEEWYMLGELRLPGNFEKSPYAQALAARNQQGVA